MLEIDCPYEDEDWDNFVTIDLGLALGSSTSRAVKWRRTDFQAAAFRRLFAKSRFDKKLFGFRSIQVSPVGETRLLQEWDCETSWITSAFAINNPVEVAIPFGTVDLTLHCEPSAPEPWQTLCQLLGIYKGQHRTIGLATGNCYRMRCSMDLTIDNGLE